MAGTFVMESGYGIATRGRVSQAGATRSTSNGATTYAIAHTSDSVTIRRATGSELAVINELATMDGLAIQRNSRVSITLRGPDAIDVVRELGIRVQSAKSVRVNDAALPAFTASINFPTLREDNLADNLHDDGKRALYVRQRATIEAHIVHDKRDVNGTVALSYGQHVNQWVKRELTQLHNGATLLADASGIKPRDLARAYYSHRVGTWDNLYVYNQVAPPRVRDSAFVDYSAHVRDFDRMQSSDEIASGVWSAIAEVIQLEHREQFARAIMGNYELRGKLERLEQLRGDLAIVSAELSDVQSHATEVLYADISIDDDVLWRRATTVLEARADIARAKRGLRAIAARLTAQQLDMRAEIRVLSEHARKAALKLADDMGFIDRASKKARQAEADKKYLAQRAKSDASFQVSSTKRASVGMARTRATRAANELYAAATQLGAVQVQYQASLDSIRDLVKGTDVAALNEAGKLARKYTKEITAQLAQRQVSRATGDTMTGEFDTRALESAMAVSDTTRI